MPSRRAMSGISLTTVGPPHSSFKPPVSFSVRMPRSNASMANAIEWPVDMTSMP